MASGISVVAHLDFEVEVAGRGVVRGTVRGQGQELTLEVDRPEVFAGRRDAASLEGLASGLARPGLRLRVLREGTHLITLGVTRAPWWHRRATGSPRIRLGSVRGAWTPARVNGAQVGEEFLRTGSRLQVGGWTLAYSREEHADHGRPHGGRIGGELGRQQPQPPRRRLQSDGAGRVDE